jgi:hypothetical protein
MSFGRYQFLSWARRGIATQIAETDTLGAANGNAEERAELALSVKLNSGEPVDRVLSLIGPGDITGFSTRSIVRTEPLNGIGDYEPNLLPYVEFYDEDFPFRYTPASAANSDRHLRPWLMLVVLKEDEFVDTDRRSPLRSIQLLDDGCLPPGDELYLWCHMHSNLPHDETDLEAFIDGLEEEVASDPDGVYSRLICPRKLEPRTLYHAFLVPSYETGRRAGLGQPTVGVKAQTPAWPGQVLELPVYHRWYFRTGQNFDFEYLVKQLEPRVMDERVGVRDMDCSRPEFVRADGSGAVRAPLPNILKLGGAVMAPNATPSRFPSTTQAQPFLEDLTDLVNLNRVQIENPDEDPYVSVPFYGMYHAQKRDRARPGKKDTPLFDPSSPNWYDELNRDPTNRVPAGFGKRVVQENQERFMDIAWQQLDDVLEANRKARLARLAELAVTRVYARTIGTQTDETFLSRVKPMMRRVRVGNVTALRAVSDSRFEMATIDGAFRRVSRFNSTITRALDKRSNAAAFSYDTMLKKVNTVNGISAELPDAFEVIPKLRNVSSFAAPGSASQIKVWSAESNLSDAFVYNRPEFVGGLPGLAEWGNRFTRDVIARPGTFPRPRPRRTPGAGGAGGRPITRVPTRGGVAAGTPSVDVRPRPTLPGATVVTAAVGRPVTLISSGVANNTLTTAKHNANVRQAYADVNERLAFKRTESAAKVLNASSTRDFVEATIEPGSAYRRLIGTLVTMPEGVWRPREEPLLPAMAYPDIHDAMYKHLVEVDQDFLLPNLKLIPNNTLSLLKTNQKFIESYLVGLNYEMGRELMWREYPTDMRGSYFRQFWDVKGLVTPDTTPEDSEELKDIKPIHTWQRGSTLGLHNARDAEGDSEQLVFVIRGDLLKKFPNTVIYAQKALDDPDSDDREDTVIRDGAMTDAEFEKEIRFPLYQAELPPDIKLLGFDLTIDEAAGVERTPGFTDLRGWYFVLAEVPGEPRFGMDIDFRPNTPGTHTWNDLAWENMPPGTKFLRRDQGPDLSPLPAEDTGKWGHDSAHMAAILLQRPVMVAIHAKEMLETDIEPELDSLPTTTLYTYLSTLTFTNR